MLHLPTAATALVPLLLDTTAQSVAFTWVDGIKILLIPVLLFVLQRTFNRRDKTTDEERAKKNAEAKEREKRLDDDIKALKEKVQQFVGEEALDKRFAKLEEAKNNHEQRMTGFQLHHERFAEDYGRRFQTVESQLGQVAQLREDMAGMKAELRGYGKSLDEMKEMLRELLRK